MGRLPKVNKDVIQQQRMDKKLERRERARNNWKRFTGKLMNIAHKAKDTFKNKIMPWIKKNITMENIEKVGKFASGLSDAARTTTGAIRDIGGVVGGKVGDTMQRGADKIDQYHQRGRDYVEDKVDRGRQIYNIGRRAYDRARQQVGK